MKLKSGYKVILTEKAYKKYIKETPKEDIDSEQHWFILDKCIEKNPGIDVIN
ncbi:hypothetical protein [Clostridium sporogenes]|uniref:hypothetical protein n=1 Tax=Clostridium sporogenes TaxID=1509 RepID=UPI0013D89CEE|nr:hypothetical protein [Clostridium sporogenes]